MSRPISPLKKSNRLTFIFIYHFANLIKDTGAHEYEIEYNEEHDYEEDDDGGIQEVTPPPATGCHIYYALRAKHN